MATADFHPVRDGWHFSNRFPNWDPTVPPGSEPPGYDDSEPDEPAPPPLFKFEGKSDAMCLTALDYFYHGVVVPAHEGQDFPNTGMNQGLAPAHRLPLEDSELYGFIYNRYEASFVDEALTWLESVPTDQQLGDAAWGVSFDEVTKLIEGYTDEGGSIIDGKPVVLGLLRTNLQNGSHIINNVICYGFVRGSNTQKRLYVYDPGRPNAVTELRRHSAHGGLRVGNNGSATYRGYICYTLDDNAFGPSSVNMDELYRDIVLTRDPSVTPEALPTLTGAIGYQYAVKNIGSYPSRVASIGVRWKNPAGAVTVRKDLVNRLLTPDGTVHQVNISIPASTKWPMHGHYELTVFREYRLGTQSFFQDICEEGDPDNRLHGEYSIPYYTFYAGRTDFEEAREEVYEEYETEVLFTDSLIARTVSVRQGDLLYFAPTGTVVGRPRARPNQAAGSGTNAPRSAAWPMPGRKQYALIGRIEDPTTGMSQYFFIGAGNTYITAPKTGNLFLLLNDNIQGDGRGKFDVYVQVVRS